MMSKSASVQSYYIQNGLVFTTSLLDIPHLNGICSDERGDLFLQDHTMLYNQKDNF